MLIKIFIAVCQLLNVKLHFKILCNISTRLKSLMCLFDICWSQFCLHKLKLSNYKYDISVLLKVC